jgi:hypothetical protein
MHGERAAAKQLVTASAPVKVVGVKGHGEGCVVQWVTVRAHAIHLLLRKLHNFLRLPERGDRKGHAGDGSCWSMQAQVYM